LAWAVFAIIVTTLALRTVVRNRDWRDNLTLFSAAVRAVPGSAKMHADLGGEYLMLGQVDAARIEFQTALRTYPDLDYALEGYGLAESRVGHDQQALRLLRTALSFTPEDAATHDFRVVNLATQLMKLGQNDEALKLLNQEIATSPQYARSWSNRAVIRYGRGELASARDDAQVALRLDPTNAQARSLLVMLKATDPIAPQR
jgi:tetratricopeptide (TPR) repeat protein